jgi:dephospho-CoA kinase
LTGGIGTGKSTVTKILIEKGFKVIDADEISREVVEVGKPAYTKIVEVFGSRILLEDKTLNRRKLGRLMFSSNSLRKLLNNIIHPYIWESIKLEIEKYCLNNEIIFLDVPLLIEELDKLDLYGIELEKIWLVYTDSKTQLLRLMERNNISEEDAKGKINAQMNLEEKKMYADRIIDNSGDLNILMKHIDSLLLELA